VVVPLPGVEFPEDTIGRLQKGLNLIYSQSVVSWNVQPLYGFTGIELGDNGLDWADKGMLSAYNKEMNSVISAFKKWKKDADKDAYYLFVVPKFSESSLEGFMPLGYSYGFISKDQLDAHTVAHELGHGAFALRHTFPEVKQGSTDNLMNYTPDKNALLKAQWDLIHDPQRPLFAWTEEMEEGAMSILKSNFSLVNYNDSGLIHNQTIYFLPEINEKITLKAKQTKNNVQEDVKVNWSYKDQKEIAEITFTANSEFFGEADKIQIDVTEKVLLGADSTLTYFVGKVDVSPTDVIDSILTSIKDIREEFDSLAQVVSKWQAENYDAISIQATSKYITQGLSEFYESPPDELSTKLDKVLARMYTLDLLIKKLENFDDLATEIASLYSNESSKQEFFNTVIESIKTINPLDTKEKLETLYKEQIINTTFEKMAGRLNNE